MKAVIKNTTLRLNMENPIHKRAWGYLQSMDKSKFGSYSNVIAIALNDYFERYYKTEDDPFFITREREDKFAYRIIQVIREALAISVFQMQKNEESNFINLAIKYPQSYCNFK